MLPLPVFQHHSPTTLADAVALMAELGDGARLIAGGTDLLPNMKHGLVEPEHLVSLAGVRELRTIVLTDEHLELGAMARLADIAAHPEVVRHAAALAEATAAVGGPHHRRMGTLGGNVCLDTRCVYFNQTYFWRQALGFCLKKDGTACHVVASGKNCVAAASNDSGPALMVLDAELELAGVGGVRRVLASEFYTPDGITNTVRRADEIVTKARIPLKSGRKSAFEKLRRRGAIDYPLLNAAARVDRDRAGVIANVEVVVSALAARPKRIKAQGALAREVSIEALVEGYANAAFKQCRPLTNLDNDTEWRRDMVKVVVARALGRAAAADPE
ncbi:MAG: 4-hydroxybenzoyl-CoA reductase subunit beta [Myxococcales bacterium]|nr:4-hydroxybenzoyl-CoA reductase subunit beta [Myxococcales bacterium]